VRDAVSAGGVVWRHSATGELEIVLCGRERDGSWALPKGTPDEGESIEETALREVREETGLEVELGESLGFIEYWFVADGARIHKRVYHWLMAAVGGDTHHHDHEFDAVDWVPVGEAAGLLTYKDERDVVARAASELTGDLWASENASG
jgi:8-oxo-dGTP pyrophosphatase MutT (NUDIX family)